MLYHLHADAYRIQGMSDPLELEVQAVVSHRCGFWESNLGLLKEQAAFLTSEASFCPLIWALRSWVEKVRCQCGLIIQILLFDDLGLQCLS